MPNLTPQAGPLNGADTITLYLPYGKGEILTLAQLRAYAQGQPLCLGAPNPPVGLPAATALAGTEQVKVAQGAGYVVATIAQLVCWAITGATVVYSPSSSGGLGGFPSLTAFDGSEAIRITQSGGTVAAAVADIRTLLTS